jgi:ribonuclease Z
MTITHQILGQPGRDNALLVKVDSGQSVNRLLFDCGEGCLSQLAISEVQAIDKLLFSHLHMDHVGGFDSFFRCTFGRDTKPNEIYGPVQTANTMHHRFQGFWWNLTDGLTASWQVHDVTEDSIATGRFESSEAFRTHYPEDPKQHTGVIINEPDYEVRVIQLQHNGPSLGYRVDEKPKTNIDTNKIAELNLTPGPWIRELKNQTEGSIEVGGQTWAVQELRASLLTETAGGSIAYLTDFLLDQTTHARLGEWLQGCETVICESQYRHEDLELAVRNHHTTTKLVGRMAADANIEQLVLFHLSERYSRDEWAEILADCQAEFPNTSFCDTWEL